jgi:glycosyltransferase involved in cell wall biosynthesis
MNTSQIRVLAITARADYGGGPEHLFRLVKELQNKVCFFIAAPNDKPYYDRYASLIGIEKMISMPHRKFSFSKLFELSRFVKKQKINLIHSHGKGAGLYGRLLKLLTNVPVVHTFHGLHLDEYSFIVKNLYLYLERILSLLTSKIIAVSVSELQRLVQNKITHSSKVQAIMNGMIMPDEHAVFSEQKPFKVLTVSRFDYSKNSELMIDIMKEARARGKINELIFVFAGDGPSLIKIKEEIENEGFSNHAVFTGMIENLSTYFKNSFCYISTSRWEGLPLAVMEAMSYGLPVIATRVTGNIDLIENGKDGFLYESENSAEAASYIIKLSSDKDLWKRFSNAAREKIRNKFTVKKMAEETYRLYEAVKMQERR